MCAESAQQHPSMWLYLGNHIIAITGVAAVLLEIPEESVRCRISGQLQCRTCGFSTNVNSVQFSNRPICPYCEGRLERRTDDDLSLLFFFKQKTAYEI